MDLPLVVERFEQNLMLLLDSKVCGAFETAALCLLRLTDPSCLLIGELIQEFTYRECLAYNLILAE